MPRGTFVQSYLDALDGIQGAFHADAALLFMAYNQLIAAEGITGDTLEIGVHHGRSAHVIATLRERQRRFVAVDLFDDLQARNVSGSGLGNADIFFHNMTDFYDDVGFMHHIASASQDLRPADLGTEFSFCHIDGGHSPAETYDDLQLCQQIVLPGGLVALDDYFNAEWPGVCEGAVQFHLEHPDALIPLAIGFNKVLFQKPPAPGDLNAAFAASFWPLPRLTVQMWGRPVYLFQRPLSPFFDATVSTPRQLVLRPEATWRARIEPGVATLQAAPGATLELPVRVANQSPAAWHNGDAAIGLSYHLLSSTGCVLRWDNPRSYLTAPLPARAACELALPVTAPEAAGAYQLELDLVWEDVMWLKERGNPTATVALTVA